MNRTYFINIIFPKVETLSHSSTVGTICICHCACSVQFAGSASRRVQISDLDGVRVYRLCKLDGSLVQHVLLCHVLAQVNKAHGR